MEKQNQFYCSRTQKCITVTPVFHYFSVIFHRSYYKKEQEIEQLMSCPRNDQCVRIHVLPRGHVNWESYSGRVKETAVIIYK